MDMLKIYVDQLKSRRLRSIVKIVFRNTYVISEREYELEAWYHSIISLVSFAYAKRYTIERSARSYSSCDIYIIDNANFDRNAESLSTPCTETEQEMFYLLNHQYFTLNEFRQHGSDMGYKIH